MVLLGLDGWFFLDWMDGFRGLDGRFFVDRINVFHGRLDGFEGFSKVGLAFSRFFKDLLLYLVNSRLLFVTRKSDYFQ
jgi:hypothetical protein